VIVVFVVKEAKENNTHSRSIALFLYFDINKEFTIATGSLVGLRNM